MFSLLRLSADEEEEGRTLAPTVLPDLSIPAPPRLGTEQFHHGAPSPYKTLRLGRGCLPLSWLGADSFSALSVTSLTAHQSPLDQNETPRVATEQQHFSSSEEAAR